MKRAASFFTLLIIAFTFCFFLKTRIVPAINSNLVFPNPKTCIIDAGHGGFDGGAVAEDGTLEKDLNLSMSKILDEILTLNGYETIMIRDEDVSVEEKTDKNKKRGDIQKRLKTAREYPQALFISIHQNSFRQRNSQGTQVFYGVKNKNSKKLANIIQQTVSEKLQPSNRRSIKKAGSNLYLLSNMENVSIMIECGFITNKSELENLKNPKYQEKLMFEVFEGIEKYFKEEEIESGEN